jgi:hypothetical protein
MYASIAQPILLSVCRLGSPHSFSRLQSHLRCTLCHTNPQRHPHTHTTRTLDRMRGVQISSHRHLLLTLLALRRWLPDGLRQGWVRAPAHARGRFPHPPLLLFFTLAQVDTLPPFSRALAPCMSSISSIQTPHLTTKRHSVLLPPPEKISKLSPPFVALLLLLLLLLLHGRLDVCKSSPFLSARDPISYGGAFLCQHARHRGGQQGPCAVRWRAVANRPTRPHRLLIMSTRRTIVIQSPTPSTYHL